MDFRTRHTPMLGDGESPMARSMGVPQRGGIDWNLYWSTRYPSALVLTVLSDTSIKLDWTNNGTQDYDLISIERSLDGSSYSEVTTKTAGTATFTDTGLTEDTLYYYRLRYKKDSQYSSYSDVNSKTTLLSLPDRNTDIVQLSSIDSITTDMTVNTKAMESGIALLIAYKPERISGNGTISQIKIHNATLTGVKQVMFYLWRKNISNTWDIIYSEDITSKISTGDGIKTITLAASPSVLEGDFVGFMNQSNSGAGNVPLRGIPSIKSTAGMIWDFTNTPSNPKNWNLYAGSNYSLPTHCMGQSPYIVHIGDSMIGGSPYHSSMLAEFNTFFDPPKSIPYKLWALDNRFIYSNCSIGGEYVTTGISARFARDVVAKKPRFAIIEGGVNDLYNGVTQANFITAYTSMLDLCVTNGIAAIVFKLFPRTISTNTDCQKRDNWNIALTNLFNSYNEKGWLLVDFDNDIGQFRPGGDEGNFWDIKTAYDYDGTHFTEAGYTKVSEIVYSEIGKKYSL